MTIFFQSPLMKIGNHEWRAIVIPSRYIGRCTDYQFRRIGDTYWKNSRDWPTYNFNDGTYSGLPRSLRRLYQEHKAEIMAALDGHTAAQQSLDV